MSSTEEKSPNEQEVVAAQEVKREIIEFVKMIVWFLIVFFLVKTYVVEGYEVLGPSMNPTLQDRERILVFKLPHIVSQFQLFSGIEALRPGDIVVFDSVEPNKRYVKRVIAKGPPKAAGNTVVAQRQDAQTPEEDSVRVLFDHGKVYVNNDRISEDYLRTEPKASEDVYPEVRLLPGGYYVLGDNRGVSKDSRSFGPVDDARVVGKAILCFWPPSRIRLLK